MSGVQFGWVHCEIPNNQITDKDLLKQFIESEDWEANPNITSEGINFNEDDCENSDSVVEDGITGFLPEAFDKGLITGTVHIRYHSGYMDDYGSSGETTDLYIDADGRIEDPLRVSISDIPFVDRLTLIKTINTMIADAKRKALLAKEEAAAA